MEEIFFSNLVSFSWSKNHRNIIASPVNKNNPHLIPKVTKI